MGLLLSLVAHSMGMGLAVLMGDSSYPQAGC